MVVIIPFKCIVDIDENSNKGTDYFFENIISENSAFSPLGITNEVLDKVLMLLNRDKRSQFSKIKHILKDKSLVDKIIPDYAYYKDVLAENRSTNIYTCNNKLESVLVQFSSDEYCIISTNITKANELLEHLKKECRGVIEPKKNSGLKFRDLISSTKYATSIIESNVEIGNNYKLGKPKNDFELKVIKEVSKLTDSFLTNVEIRFSRAHETFEYDILVFLSGNLILDIEPTSFLLLKNTQSNMHKTMKSELILSAIDKSQKLRAKTIVITEGLAANTHDQMKKLADNRKITLLNEHNFKENLESIILNSCIPTAESSSQTIQRLFLRSLGDLSKIRM